MALNSEANKPQARTLEEMDMLIRAASSCLSITNPTTEVKMGADERNPQYKTLNKLNRIAMLLDTKDSGDSVAVMVSAMAESTRVFVVSSSTSSPLEEQIVYGSVSDISVAQNPVGYNNDINPLVPAGPNNDEIGTFKANAIRKIVEKGVRPLYEHTAELQERLNEYLAEESPATKKEILENLSMFTYLQCQAKILQRLKVPIHPFTKVQFYEAFRPGNIDVDKLSKGCYMAPGFNDNELDKKSSSFNERPFAKRMKAYTGFDFKFDDRNRIILDDESVAHFHNYIWKLLSATRTNLETLETLTNVGIVGDVNVLENKAKQLLVTVHRNLSHLNALANKSPTLRQHINNPSIQDWLAEQGRIYMQKGDRAEITKDARYALEDEGALGTSERVCLDPTGSLRKWLQLCTQWTNALADIALNLANPITISIVEAPQSPHPRKQASLDALLNFVLDNPSQAKFSKVKEALQRISALKLVSRIEEFPSMWQALTEESWAIWEDSFAGNMHCESVVACLEGIDLSSEELVTKMSKSRLAELQEANAMFEKCYPWIGVSKACCHLCASYISYRGALGYFRTSGRVSPWLMPVWEIDRKIFEKMLAELKERVWKSLKALGVLKGGLRYYDPDGGNGPSPTEETFSEGTDDTDDI